MPLISRFLPSFNAICKKRDPFESEAPPQPPQPHYKLIYLPLRAKGECARQMFALAGVKYEDVRINPVDWPNYKHETPFGKCAVLEVNGKQLAQSRAIFRYLARQLGFAGKDEWESAQIDALVDQLSDHFDVFGKLHPFYRVSAGVDEGDKNQLYQELVVPARDAFLPTVTSYLKENKSGYLIGHQISWADLMVSELVAWLEHDHPGFARDYPEVLAHMRRIRSIPALKKWLEERPESPI